jgi:hypothetical protein
MCHRSGIERHQPPFQLLDLVLRGEVRHGQQQAVGQGGLLDRLRMLVDLPYVVGPGANLDPAIALASLRFLASFCQF